MAKTIQQTVKFAAPPERRFWKPWRAYLRWLR